MCHCKIFRVRAKKPLIKADRFRPMRRGLYPDIAIPIGADMEVMGYSLNGDEAIVMFASPNNTVDLDIITNNQPHVLEISKTIAEDILEEWSVGVGGCCVCKCGFKDEDEEAAHITEHCDHECTHGCWSWSPGVKKSGKRCFPGVIEYVTVNANGKKVFDRSD